MELSELEQSHALQSAGDLVQQVLFRSHLEATVTLIVALHINITKKLK